MVGRVSPLVHGLIPQSRKEGKPGIGSLWKTDAAGPLSSGLAHILLGLVSSFPPFLWPQVEGQ